MNSNNSNRPGAIHPIIQIVQCVESFFYAQSTIKDARGLHLVFRFDFDFDFDGKIRRYSTVLGTVQQDPGESLIHNFCLHIAATEKKSHINPEYRYYMRGRILICL